MSELHVKGLSDDAPPPSAALEQLVAAGKPVRMRRPLLAWLATLAAAFVYGAMFFSISYERPDMPFLSRALLGVSVAAWGGAFLLATWLALVPRRGQVLLDGVRAFRVGLGLLLALLLTSAFVVVDAEGHSQAPSADLGSAWHCGRFAIVAWLMLMAVTFRSVRDASLATPWQVGAIIGLAGGALSGLLLVFRCPIGGAAHVVMGHFGGMALAAVLGAVLGGWALRR